jgi:hypothetical protein
MPVGGAVKGIANGTSVERIEFEVEGVGYWIEILSDPPARVWNSLKTVKPGETAFDQDTRVLGTALVAWDLGIEIEDGALEDLQEPVRLAMVQLVTQYYVGLQKKHADILEHIYRPGGDGTPADPTPGSATASASPARSKGSRRTR